LNVVPLEVVPVDDETAVLVLELVGETKSAGQSIEKSTVIKILQVFLDLINHVPIRTFFRVTLLAKKFPYKNYFKNNNKSDI